MNNIKTRISNDELKKQLSKDYESRWVEAMISKSEEIFKFLEDNKELDLSFQEVFFSSKGYVKCELNGNEFIFSIPSSLFPAMPLNRDAENPLFKNGKFHNWYKKSNKIEFYKR